MPSLIVYTNPLTPGICQMPVYTVGDNQNWTLRFNDGTNFYNPTGVTMNIGFVRGLGNLTFGSGFQWVDRMNNQHTGSFVIAAGVPGTLTWDENPIGVAGDFGAWLLRGRTPPSARIRKVYVKYGGTGISTAPLLRFDGGSTITGKGATITPTVSAGDVTALTITNPGQGYSSSPLPEIIITGDGTGSVWKVTETTGLIGGHILALTKVSTGSGYTTATVTVRDPEATATVTVGGSSGVTGINLVNAGSGYTTAPTIAITGGGGTLATATSALANATWGLSGTTITNAGTLYASTPTVSLSGGTGSGATIIATASGYQQVVGIVPIGVPYFSTPQATVDITGGGGSGAAATAVFGPPQGTNYPIIGFVVTSGGSGYTGTPTVTVTSVFGGFSVNATPTIGTGAITSLTVTNPGTGYGVTAPTITITAPGGGGVTATATAQLTGSPISPVITVTAAGSGYTSVPAVGFSGGAGTGASALAVVSLGITAITMVQNGYAYTSLPSLTIIPDNGALLIPAGVESHSVPFIQNLNPVTLQGAVTVTPYTNGRRDASGNLIYDDSLLVIRPRYLSQPTLTLQNDSLTWAAVFTPVTTMVQAVLNYRRSFVADVEIFGGGRLLFVGSLTIAAA